MVEDIGLQGTLDHGTFDLLDETVSGHTLKHLSTAAAACMALPMLRNPVLFSFSLEHFSPWPVERDRS